MKRLSGRLQPKLLNTIRRTSAYQERSANEAVRHTKRRDTNKNPVALNKASFEKKASSIFTDAWLLNLCNQIYYKIAFF